MKQILESGDRNFSLGFCDKMITVFCARCNKFVDFCETTFMNEEVPVVEADYSHVFVKTRPTGEFLNRVICHKEEVLLRGRIVDDEKN